MPKRHKPANNNWGKAMSLSTNYGAQHVSEFDQMVAELELPLEQFESNVTLRAWVKKHYRQRYVPEFLLVLWDLQQTYDDF